MNGWTLFVYCELPYTRVLAVAQFQLPAWKYVWVMGQMFSDLNIFLLQDFPQREVWLERSYRVILRLAIFRFNSSVMPVRFGYPYSHVSRFHDSTVLCDVITSFQWDGSENRPWQFSVFWPVTPYQRRFGWACCFRLNGLSSPRTMWTASS